MLGALGATDWVDGYLARRLGQVSEFGKVFDPTADRILFIVAIVAIMIDGSMPIWFGVAVLAREVLVGLMMVVATLVFKMERIDVTWLGKVATFLLMFAVPGFLMGNSDFPGRRLVRGRGVDPRHPWAGAQLLHGLRLHPRRCARGSPAIGQRRPRVLYRRPLEDGYGCTMNIPAELRYSTRPRMGPPRRQRGHDRHHRVRPGLTRRHRVRRGARRRTDGRRRGFVHRGREHQVGQRHLRTGVGLDRRRSTKRSTAQPELLNSDPYGEGWICTIEMSEPTRVRRSARCRRLPSPDRRLRGVTRERLRVLQSVRAPQPADERVLLELRVAARLARRSHGHADRDRSAAGRAGHRRRHRRSRSASCRPRSAC